MKPFFPYEYDTRRMEVFRYIDTYLRVFLPDTDLQLCSYITILRKHYNGEIRYLKNRAVGIEFNTEADLADFSSDFACYLLMSTV